MRRRDNDRIFSINEFHVHVRFILVRSNGYPCRISRNLFSDEDLCAISYDNGHIHLYSTFNDTLKLVKGKCYVK